ncbi:MAG: response regulator [Planctomycetes bacterium]|nr:response regulator [Planctomycetota bacterium]
MPKDVLTTGEVAKLCHVTIRTVIKWFEKGHLKGYKIPGSRDRRFARGDVLAFMQGHGIPNTEPDADAGARKRILVVDDEAAVVEIMVEYLRQLGMFEWQTAKNGYEAGLKTQSFRPHVLLTDYNLGDITGVQVAETVRATPELAKMRIIVVSGVLSEADAPQLREKGIDAFVRKPFTFEQLRDAILKQLKMI